MKREIPQKIDTALSLSGKLVNQPHPTNVVSTLLRRTRSVSVLGFVITVSAFGGLMTERSANAVVAPAQLKPSAHQPLQLPDLVGSSRYQLSTYRTQKTSSRARVFQTRTDPNTPALVASKPVPNSTVLITQHSTDLLAVRTSPRIAATQKSQSEKSSSIVSFTQSNLAGTSPLLSSAISLTTQNLLASTDILDLSNSDNILELGTTDIFDNGATQVGEPLLIAESPQQYLLDLDALLAQADDTASDVALNPAAVSNPLDLSTSLDDASQSNDSLEIEDAAADVPDPQALDTQGAIAVLPDIDLSQTIIPNDQNSALIDSGAIVHKVKPGETLEDISRLYQISAKEIKKANRITDPSSIGPKTQLRIPAHQSLSMSLKTAPDIVELDSKALADDVLLDKSYQADKNNADVIRTSSGKAGKAKTPVAVLPSSPQLTPSADNGKTKTIIATRSVLPQVPSLELPPLSSVDRYLPSQMLPGPQKYLWPAKGVLTSGYGWRWGRPHRGIDIAAPVGTPVVASAPGVVTTAGWNRWGYGNLVEIRHPDGSLTLYAHNHKIKTRVGQSVYQGQQIAEMGSTGLSTGPHTHFELHSAGKGAINPMPFLRKL